MVCVAFLPGALSSQNATSSWRNWVPVARYWSDVAQELAQILPEARIKRFPLPVDGTIEERALFFRSQLTLWKDCPPPASVSVVAHSQAGLDVRYAKQSLQLQRVAGLITVGTPHLGSEFAGWAVAQRDGNTFWFKLLRLGGYDLGRVPFLDQLVPGFVQAHSAAFATERDFLRAGYIAADCESSDSCGLKFRVARWAIGLGSRGGGDGLVSIASQRFGVRVGEVELDHQHEVLSGPSGRSERLRIARDVANFFVRGKM